MNKIFRIMRMEFRLTAMNKLFLVFTLLGPFLIAFVAILPEALMSSGAFRLGKTENIAIVGAEPYVMREITENLRPKGIFVDSIDKTDSFQYSDLETGTYDGVIIITEDASSAGFIELVARSALSFRVVNELEKSIGNAIVFNRFYRSGIEDGQIATIVLKPSFSHWRLTNDGRKEKAPVFVDVLSTGLFFSMFLYITLILYGQIIARSVLMEKTSKTVEILLSSVRSRDLLIGKIFGNSMASLLQFGFWIVSSALLIKAIGPRFGYSTKMTLTLSGFAWVAMFFVLAYFLYCAVYAALGAASQDEQHLGQLSWPVIILLVIPVIFITQILTFPRSPVIVAMSIFPFTSPIVMFLRIQLDSAPPAEIVLSVALSLATTVGMLLLSAKIFSAGVLLSGKRLDYRGIMKLLWSR